MEADNLVISPFAEDQIDRLLHTWSAVCGSDSAPAMVNDRTATDAELVGVTLNPIASDADKKAAILRWVYRYLESSGDWQLPSTVDRLDRISASADQVNFVALRAQLKLFFKSIAAAKGRRYSVQANEATNSGPAAALNPSAAGVQVPRGKESAMSILLTVKDIKPVPEGQHNAIIRAIEERESKFSDSRYQRYLAVTFELTDGVIAGRTLVKGFSPALSSKSNLGKLWKRLKGDLPVGQALDVEDLIGERVQIVVVHEMSEDGEIHERISEIFKLLTADEAKTANEKVLTEAVS
jgi:hypothetical protein